MDREDLAEALSAARSCESAVPALAALPAGAKFELWPGASSAAEFSSVFRRRRRNGLRAGRPSIGFAEGARELDAYHGSLGALGHVNDRPRGGTTSSCS
ncbi:hypothetical protein [Amycolatopsis sp. NPDC051903]|uniref:hypothetical protein n=1 Tax=Amycolatopsis sp. NPDC051903 TaxID=3363936 RepID=UPI0037A529E1